MSSPLDSFRAYGRLMRLSLAPTAAADIAVGVVWAGAGRWPDAGWAPARLILASLCIVHGAMILNDWSDRGSDSITRPDRPIPSGQIAAGTAARVSLALLLAAPLLAASAGPGLLLPTALLAGLAALYDLGLRGPLLGPLILGSCRGGNLALGWWAGSHWADLGTGPGASAAAGPDLAQPLFPFSVLPALLYGGYVFFVSRLGRLEDGEDALGLENRPPFYLWGAAICLACAPLTLIPLVGARFGIFAGCVLSFGGAFPLAREAASAAPWTAARVGANMGRALRRMLIFTAAVALASLERSFSNDHGSWAGLYVAALVLCGYPLSFWLRRIFPPS